MVPRPAVRSAVWTEQWWESYGRLAGDRQASCDRVVMALIKGIDTPGLNVKPILPDKHYLEGRISSGDRVVFRLEGTTIFFIDVVEHDASAAMGGARGSLAEAGIEAQLARKRLARAWEGEEDALYDYL